MAKPIKETPFLSGKDAEVFIKDNKKVRKISNEEQEIILNSFMKFQKISIVGH